MPSDTKNSLGIRSGGLKDINYVMM